LTVLAPLARGGWVRVSGFVLAGVLVLALGGCASGGASTASNPANAKRGADGLRGGTLALLSSSPTIDLDPALALSTTERLVAAATQRALYAYLPSDPTTMVPDLAAGPPHVSLNGRTVRVALRPGVRFAPPVSRQVTSADVAYAIQRGFNPHVASPWAARYFGHLLGARRARGGALAGIRTPDPRTIVFRLDRAAGSYLAQALVLPLSAPVPRTYAAPLDAHSPSTYRAHPAATGPYTPQALPRVGVAALPRPNLVRLVRNANWVAGTDVRPAFVDEVDLRLGQDPTGAAMEVLAGSHGFDADPPPDGVIGPARQRHAKQIYFSGGAGSEYVALNTAMAPFDRLDTRRAVYAAMDRTRLAAARGAPLAGEVANHFLYTGMNGSREAGGLVAPGLDFAGHPSGDMGLARSYMRRAGYRSGRATGAARVTIVGSLDAPDAQIARQVSATLDGLGFVTRLLLVSRASMFSRYCGEPRMRVQVCPSVGWVRDVSDPEGMLLPAFNGGAIVPTHNLNWSQLDDPAVNAAMAQAETAVGLAARAIAWGRVDDMISADAPAVVYDWVRRPTVWSSDVECVNATWDGGVCDLTYSSLH